MDKGPKILIIYPEEDYTKIGIFSHEKIVFQEDVPCLGNKKDYEIRIEGILKVLKKQDINVTDIEKVVSCAGVLRPTDNGVYKVEDNMVDQLKDHVFGDHIHNLGALIAYKIGKIASCDGWVVDPMVMNFKKDYMELSGNPTISRKHMLDGFIQKDVAKEVAKDMNKSYEEMNLLVVDMGEDISIGVHKKGQIIDSINTCNGEGPFSLKMSGSVPQRSLVRFCYLGQKTFQEMEDDMTQRGGVYAYLAIDDPKKMREGIDQKNNQTNKVYQAMAYQIAKYIGGMSISLRGKIDAIVLTGKLSKDDLLVNWIKEYVSSLGKVKVYPKDEIKALGIRALDVIKGEEKLKVYR